MSRIFRHISRTARGTNSLAIQIGQIDPNNQEQVNRMKVKIEKSMSRYSNRNRIYCDEIRRAIDTNNYDIALHISQITPTQPCNLFERFIYTDKYTSGEGFPLAHLLFQNSTMSTLHNPLHIPQIMIPYQLIPTAVLFDNDVELTFDHKLAIDIICMMIRSALSAGLFPVAFMTDVIEWYLTKLFEFGPDALNPDVTGLNPDRQTNTVLPELIMLAIGVISAQRQSSEAMSPLTTMICDTTNTNPYFYNHLMDLLEEMGITDDITDICPPRATASFDTNNLVTEFPRGTYSTSPTLNALNTSNTLTNPSDDEYIPRANAIPLIPTAQREPSDGAFHVSDSSEMGVRLRKQMGGKTRRHQQHKQTRALKKTTNKKNNKKKNKNKNKQRGGITQIDPILQYLGAGWELVEHPNDDRRYRYNPNLYGTHDPLPITPLINAVTPDLRDLITMYGYTGGIYRIGGVGWVLSLTEIRNIQNWNDINDR